MEAATAFRFDLGRRLAQLFLMVIVTEQQARAQWSKLLIRARDGEEIVITRDGKPYAKMVPLDTEEPKPAVRAEPVEALFFASRSAALRQAGRTG
jgi:prevent-host-death family protein